MQAPYNDRWERTKRYLLRNFLVNPGFRLSPIPEEDRSSPDSGSLPDLVVERVPDRHDHAPEYYEGLECRMKRYYRQLFLGSNGIDDYDSFDFEVNRNMGSTFMIEANTRKYNEKNILREDNDTDSDLEVSIPKERELTTSTIETDDGEVTEAESEDKLIETCATYDETGQATDDSKNSIIDDEENMKLIESYSVNGSNQSYESDIEPNLNIEAYNFSYGDANDDNGSSLKNKDRPKSSYVSGQKQTINDEEEVEIIEIKSDSEGSAPYHRISTTAAEVHETRPRRASIPEFDNGSPVLIPRLLQLSRIIFGSSVRNSGQSFNVLEASDDFIKRLSHKHDELKNNDTQKQETPLRLIRTSDLTRASLDSSTEAVHCLETENEIQEDINNEHNIGHEINEQPGDDTPVQTDSDLHKDFSEERNLRELKDDHDAIGKKNTTTETTGISEPSIDWNKDQNSDEEIDNMVPIAQSSEKSIDDEEPELMRDARVSGGNLSWHGEAGQSSSASAFETETNADNIENGSSAFTEINASFEKIEETGKITKHTSMSQKVAKIIDEFWSVSSEDLDFEQLPKDRSRKRDSESDSFKRKTSDSGSNGRLTDSENGSTKGEGDSESGSKKRKTGSKSGSDTRKTYDSVSNKKQADSDSGTLEGKSDSESESNRKIDPESSSHKRKSSESGSKKRKPKESGSNQRKTLVSSSKKRTTSESDSMKGKTLESDSNKGKSSESGFKKRKTFESGSKKRKTSERSSNTRKTSISGSIQRKTSESGSNNIQTDSETGSTKNKTERRSNKSQTNSDEVPSLKRMKKDMAIQTGSHEEHRDWEDVRSDFFVGTPLMVRLCGCPDHVCS